MGQRWNHRSPYYLSTLERLGQFRGVDLIAKELMTHKQCYLEYTRCLEDSEAENSDQNVDDKGDFEGVKAFINQAVLGCNKAVSISVVWAVVHEIYGTGFGQQYERSKRAKLKSKLMSEYGEKLQLLTIDGKSLEVIASSEGLNTATTIRDKDFILKEAANYLREDILEYAANLRKHHGHPQKNHYAVRERFAFNIRKFFSTVLKSKEHSLAEPFKRFVHSYSSDLIHGVTRGKVITLKHFLIGIGQHNSTGLKVPIKILSNLGHSINYNLVCEVETTEAELALKLLEEDQGVHSLLPISDNATVLTYWWADNFNQTLEMQTSHGEINSTHTVEFAEKSQSTRDSDATISVPRTGRRSLQMTNQQLSNIKLDK